MRNLHLKGKCDIHQIAQLNAYTLSMVSVNVLLNSFGARIIHGTYTLQQERLREAIEHGTGHSIYMFTSLLRFIVKDKNLKNVCSKFFWKNHYKENIVASFCFYFCFQQKLQFFAFNCRRIGLLVVIMDVYSP